MKGSRRIIDLITDETTLKAGRINIIEANVSAGKTYFALNALPAWAGTPEKVLYLIDTTNGELSIQRNSIAIDRLMYSFYDYNTKKVWGENESTDKMPVMTYAGFAAEVMKNNTDFHWLSGFKYIVCDEMQNLVHYRYYKNNRGCIELAEYAIRKVVEEGKTKVIALSSTPEPIRKHFGSLCYDVPFDRTELYQLETFAEIPFCGRLEDIILHHKGQKGILYTTEIESMKRYIEFANQNGVAANGFWSIHAEKPMSGEQLDLRRHVLDNESIPHSIDLLVINAASETCIKIQGDKSHIDYMIVNDSEDEVKIQVRGRYNGDLPTFYYHDIEEANTLKCSNIPERFLNKRLYHEEQEELCSFLKLADPKASLDEYYKMRKVREYLEKGGYHIDYKKDSRNGGKHYYVITRK